MELPQNKVERNILLKKIFDYCIKVNWQKTKLDELARELGTTRTDLRKLAKRYAKEILSSEEYKNLCEEVDEIVDFERKDTKTKLSIVNPILLKKTGKSTYLLWENKEEKELVLKYIYDYCIKENWNKLKLEELAKELSITSSKIKELAKRYVKEYLTPEDYELLKQHFNNNSISNRELNKITLPIINPILLKKTGKQTYLLWENEEEKELVLKYIYFYCKSFTFYTPKIEQLSSLIGISPRKIKEFCKEYALNYLNLSEEQYKQMLMECIETNKEYTHDIIKSKSKNRNSKSKVIYDALLNTSSLETIIKILDKNDMNKHYILSSGISNYVIIHHNGDEQIKEELKRKIKMYTDYVSKQKKEKKRSQKEKDNQEKISIAVTTIQAFIDDKECNSIEYFCKINNISKKDFSKYVDMIAEINFELFSQYDSKVTMMQKERYSELTEKIREIVIFLKIGIKEHEIVRPFDIIDYFLLTQMSFKDISRIAEEIITRNDYNLLKKFINQNTEATNNDPSLIKQVMLEKTIINYQKDKKGQPIPGTEETLSNEEKTKIFNYLKQNKIPTNRKTYNIAYRRYINGTLDLNLILSIINPILQKKTGKITYELWETDEEKELVLKYIYYYCYNFNFSNTSIEQLSNLLGISKSIINECCKEYALKCLQWTETQYNQKRFECSEILSKQKTPKSK